MRAPISLYLLLMTGVAQIAAAANPCMPAPRVPGTPIEAPHAVFDAYVIEVHAPQYSRSAFGVQRTRRALVEVIRSFHGPYGPGQQVEALAIDEANSCDVGVESGAHVIVGSDSGGPFEIVETLTEAGLVAHGPFATLALAADERRHSRRSSLKHASLRGEIDGALAAKLFGRARPGRGQQCEISSVGNFAQVSWGKAFGGNDARHKVIFEHTDRGWVEILRYQAPAQTPTPARNRMRRGKQRPLWAEVSGLRSLAGASADSTS